MLLSFHSFTPSPDIPISYRYESWCRHSEPYHSRAEKELCNAAGFLCFDARPLIQFEDDVMKISLPRNAKTYTVEHNVPYDGRRRAPAYPWDQMAVGDSIKFDGEDYARARSAATKYQVYHRSVNGTDTIQFRGRCYPGDGGRIWRVQ